MIKLFSILFAHLILFQSFNVGLEDALKINAFMEHASFHKEFYGDSFYEFVTEHYGEAFKTHGKAHKEHENLPFKSDHQNCHHFTSVFIPHTVSFNLHVVSCVNSSKTFFYSEWYTFIDKPSIFQPPRQA